MINKPVIPPASNFIDGEVITGKNLPLPGSSVETWQRGDTSAITQKFGHGGLYVNPDNDDMGPSRFAKRNYKKAKEAARNAANLYNTSGRDEDYYEYMRLGELEDEAEGAYIDSRRNNYKRSDLNTLRQIWDNPDENNIYNNAFPGEPVTNYFEAKELARNPLHMGLQVSNPLVTGSLVLLGLMLYNRYSNGQSLAFWR